nr:C40 family peptidase [Piscinibacter gummiphilus]
MRRSASALLTGALFCLAAHASPQQPTDAVSKLIQDKGLAPTFLANPNPGPVVNPSAANAPATHAPSFVEKVRDSASGMVVSAMNFLGVRYVRGGNSAEEGFDCSGFTRYIFENSLGLILPRRADEQATAPGLVKVKRDELQPGDLVFFNTLRRTFSHVGIYVGDNKFIHAPRTGGNVRVEDMQVKYWSKRFTGARRPAEGHLKTVAYTPASTGTPAAVAAPALQPAPVSVPATTASPAPAAFPLPSDNAIN